MLEEGEKDGAVRPLTVPIRGREKEVEDVMVMVLPEIV